MKQFTLEQIKAAHAKVKSGADFPAYISELKQLGLILYEHRVSDGCISYKGEAGFHISSDPKWPARSIASASSEKLKKDLKAHQQGLSDYPTFCLQAAEAGVDKWIVNLQNMTCAYYDLAGNTLLVEAIPQA